MNQLYDIERRALEWTNDARTEVHQQESKLVLDRLGNWLDGVVAKSVLPSSKLGLALNYVRNHLMSLVASVHRHELDVYEYLRDVIEHLNRGTAKPSELLPEVWKASHREAVRTYREVERRDKAEQARLRNAKRRLIS